MEDNWLTNVVKMHILYEAHGYLWHDSICRQNEKPLIARQIEPK